MNFYDYDPDTGAYLGGVRKARFSQLDGTPLIPKFATKTAPPTPGKDQVAVFEGGQWGLKADDLGRDYTQADGTPAKTHRYEQQLPEGAVWGLAPSPFHTFEKGAFVYDEAAHREAWRETAMLDRRDFAMASAEREYITIEEARAWLAIEALPQNVIDVIEANFPAAKRELTKLHFLSLPMVTRAGDLMGPVGEAYGADDLALDALFGFEPIDPADD